MRLVRRAADRTHPFLVLGVMIAGGIAFLSALFIYAGPLGGGLLLLAVAILVAGVLELYEQAELRGWL